MTRTIILNEVEYPAFHWTEASAELVPSEIPEIKHVRNEALLSNGVSELGIGEVYFECDQTFAFDTTFSLKGDGRKFVIIASSSGKHVAKPY